MMSRLIACVMLAAMALAAPATAQTRQPLLIEGKTVLFQRVLTRPGASIAQGVGAPGEQALDPFTPLYVYGRHPVDGGGATYLEVGTDAKGDVLGFLPEPETVPWRHALVLAFAERINRDRTLFFRDQGALDAWLDDPDLVARADDARRAIDAGTLPPGSPIISIEPEVHVDFEENFYMLPILSAERRRLKSGARVRDIEIASVSARDVEPALKRRINPADLDDFRAGVMFVIDASSSMGPYIDRTVAVMDKVLARVEAAGLSDKVRFGLLAYRDDPDQVEGIEFLTRTFADPNEIRGADDFAAAVTPLAASTVSTRAFAEDAFSAIDAGLSSVDWSGFGARYLVLITDASARTGVATEIGGKPVPASRTGFSVDAMQQVIRANKAALYVMHLKTPAGAGDHARAEVQYRRISRYAGLPPLYFPVEGGDPAIFASRIEDLADALVGQVKSAYQVVTEKTRPAPEAAPTIGRSAEMIGRAMALAHLGRAKGVEAPTMFRAWASDRDLADPEVAGFSVRVLLTRNQLSDLQKTLQLTVDALEAGQIDPDDLFNRLRSAALSAGRDPSGAGQGAARDMQASGLVGEYLDGLPYRSRLMDLSEDDWIAMGVGDQQAIIDEAHAAIRLYQRFHDDAARWVALNEGADPGDHVYPIPLEALP